MYEFGINHQEQGKQPVVTQKKKNLILFFPIGYQLLKIPHETMTLRLITPSCHNIGSHDLIQVIMTTVSSSVSFQKTAFVSILLLLSVLQFFLPLFPQCFLSLGSGGLRA